MTTPVVQEMPPTNISDLSEKAADSDELSVSGASSEDVRIIGESLPPGSDRIEQLMIKILLAVKAETDEDTSPHIVG